MADPQWERYPAVAHVPTARTWLQIQANLDRAPNTIDAYGRDLDDYLHACQRLAIDPEAATKADLARYVRDLTQRPNPRHARVFHLDSGAGLSNATLQRHLTVVRLYLDYLVEENVRATNPLGRGRYTPGTGFDGARDRALLRRCKKLPWIPNEDQWQAILQVVVREPIRNRFMFALSYDCGLRREELCALATSDIEPRTRIIHIRAEHTKSRRAREVLFSLPTKHLYDAYLVARRPVSRARGPLFLSMSNQNRAQPISIWTWSKVMARIAATAGVPHLTPHTLRHLCLTDLARSGWDLNEIATFAGHQNLETTRLYIHLSGRDLAAKLARGMDQIHAWRAAMLAEEPT